MFYIPNERVLVLGDENYKLVSLRVQVTDKYNSTYINDINIQFKHENNNTRSIDFDNIDTSKIEKYNIPDLEKIEKSGDISIPVIEIKKITDGQIIRYYLPGQEKSESVIRCKHLVL